MTDKVVKTGIEDVLSSIKRLVSEEDRKIPGLLSSTITRKPGRLVLTDALRVSDPVAVEDQPKEHGAAYRAEDSVKPMLLRTCDIVKHAEPAAEQKQQAEPEDTPAESLSAKIEALEAAIAKTEDQWEPDGDSDDAYAGTSNATLVWGSEQEFNLVDVKNDQDDAPDQADTAAATFIRGKREPATEAPKAGLAMDEEALRALIAEVVREELQGVLGQRITRNVRKMVRREIYRALAEQKSV